MFRWIPGLLALGLTLPALAETAGPPPDVLVREVTARVQADIAENREIYRADPAKLAAMIDEQVVPHFDVPRITRLVLGQHGRNATPEQLARFGEAFKTMLFKSYASALLEYQDSVRIEWQPLNLPADATRATVQSTLIRTDAAPVPVSFVLQKTAQGWKVFDITVENISLINNFRAQLHGEISRNGLDAVIQRLESGQMASSPAVSG